MLQAFLIALIAVAIVSIMWSTREPDDNAKAADKQARDRRCEELGGLVRKNLAE